MANVGYHKYTRDDDNIIRREVSKSRANISKALCKAAAIIFQIPELENVVGTEMLYNYYIKSVSKRWYRYVSIGDVRQNPSKVAMMCYSKRWVTLNRKTERRGTTLKIAPARISERIFQRASDELVEYLFYYKQN